MTSDLTPLEGEEPGALVESDRPFCDWEGGRLYVNSKAHASLERTRKETERNRTKVGLHNYLEPKGAYIVAY